MVNIMKRRYHLYFIGIYFLKTQTVNDHRQNKITKTRIKVI